VDWQPKKKQQEEEKKTGLEEEKKPNWKRLYKLGT